MEEEIREILRQEQGGSSVDQDMLNFPIDPEIVGEIPELKVRLVEPSQSFLIDDEDGVQLRDVTVELELGGRTVNVGMDRLNIDQVVSMFITWLNDQGFKDNPHPHR